MEDIIKYKKDDCLMYTKSLERKYAQHKVCLKLCFGGLKMGIFRPQKYIFMSIKLFTIFSIKCYEESHKINEWKFSCDTTTHLALRLVMPLWTMQ